MRVRAAVGMAPFFSFFLLKGYEYATSMYDDTYVRGMRSAEEALKPFRASPLAQTRINQRKRNESSQEFDYSQMYSSSITKCIID